MIATKPIKFPVDGEFYRNCGIIFSNRWHGKEITLCVTAVTGLDYIVVANPMPLPQSLRNNEIERLFERLVAGIAEQPLGARIPKANDAGSIRGYDRVGTTGE